MIGCGFGITPYPGFDQRWRTLGFVRLDPIIPDVLAIEDREFTSPPTGEMDDVIANARAIGDAQACGVQKMKSFASPVHADAGDARGKCAVRCRESPQLHNSPYVELHSSQAEDSIGQPRPYGLGWVD